MQISSKPKLLLFNFAETDGGAERTTAYLADFFLKNGWDVSILSAQTMDFWRKYGLDPTKIKYYFYPQKKFGFFPETYYHTKQEIRKTAQLFKQIKPDLILALKHNASILSVLAQKLYHLPTKIITSPRGPSIEGIRLFFPEKKWRWYFFTYLFTRFSRGLIAPTKGLAEEHRKFFGGKNVYYVYNGIDLQTIIEEAGQAKTDPNLAFFWCGRLSPEKNLLMVLKVFKRFKYRNKHKLYIIGQGNEENTLKQFVKKNNLHKRVIFLGFQKKPWQFLKEENIFIHSALLEGFGYSIVEAMACKMVVIAQNCPYGPKEILENKWGLLYHCEEELLNYLQVLIENKEIRKYWSEKARQRAKVFSKERMCEGYLKILNQILNYG